MSHALNRFQTLRLLERKWLERAWSDEALGNELGINRSTVHKNRKALMQLEGDDIFIEAERGQYRLDKQKYLPNLRVSKESAAIFYTMAKRLIRQQHQPDQHTERLLHDLAFVLHQPLMDRLLRAMQAIEKEPTSSKDASADHLAKVIEGWLTGTVLRIKYQALTAETPTIHRVHPYLLEPSPWNESIYLIGKSELTGKIISFKVDRISAVNTTTVQAEYDEDFDENQLLQLTWGIWLGDSPKTVKLRFAQGAAARRLQETKWHPTETVHEDENGDLIWEAQVADWREMLPWIRGWGSAVEVLAPPALRGIIIRHVRELMRQYGLQAANTEFNSLQKSRDPESSSAIINTPDYVVENEGPTPAEDVSPELMDLFNQFMSTDDDE